MKKIFLILLLTALVLFRGAPEVRSAPTTSQDYVTANKLFAASKFQEALALYQKILVSPPEGVPLNDIYTRIGDTHFHLGSYEDALTAYRVALKDTRASRNAETQYWIGFCCIMLGRDAEAVQEFLKIPRLYPRAKMWVSTAYYWAGRASERLGKPDEAAQYYRKAAGKGNSTQESFARKRAEAIKP